MRNNSNDENFQLTFGDRPIRGVNYYPDTENGTNAIVQNDTGANSIPLWTWVAIAGGFVTVFSGMVFCNKTKKVNDYQFSFP